MEDLIPTIFVVLILVTIVELIVKGAWLPLYFRVGIPLFKKSIRLYRPPDLSVDYLNGQFEEGWDLALLFKQISLHEVAFREAFFYSKFPLLRILFSKSTKSSSYTRIMHGLIRYDETTGELHVIGFANWFPLLFTIFVIAYVSTIPISEPIIILVFTVISLAIFAIGYFRQAKRYTAVFNTLSSEEI